jgi:hypothetical protein
MALPVFDNSAQGNASAATVTISYAASGANRLAFAQTYSVDSNARISTITANAVNLTNIATLTDPGAFELSLWYILAPSTSAINYVATWTGTVTSVRELQIVSYTGVDQSTPLGTAVTNSGTSTTPSTGSFTSSTAELAIGAMETADGNGLASTSGATQRAAGTGSFPPLMELWDQVGAASSNVTWSESNSAIWAAIGVSLKGVAGAAPPLESYMPQMPMIVIPVLRMVPSGPMGGYDTKRG